MKFLLYILFFLSATSLFGQNGNPYFSSARDYALGGTSLTFKDVRGITGNPASIAFISGLELNLSAEQRFAISELGNYKLDFALPTNSGNFGISLNHFGFDAYSEQKFNLSYARKISPKIALGANFDYLNTRIEEYGNKGTFTFGLGFQFQLVEELRVASYIYNPIRSEIINDERLASLLRIGASYTPGQQLELVFEFEKSLDFDVRFKGGIEYKLLDPLYLRVGLATNPTLFSFGTGINIKDNISVDISISRHQILGFSPALSIFYHKN